MPSRHEGTQVLPDQWPDQQVSIRGGGRGIWSSKTYSQHLLDTNVIAHGDVSGGDQRAYLSIAYVAGIAADTDLIPICSFSSSLQSELELIQRAYVDSSICTLWPSCWEINAGLRPDIKHIVA
ncbi:hypothetical protein UB48_15260 [Pseudomonas sp. 2(2015)]|nr:hypothetical protein UB48_15260 [Pseudomonas sp. 2(2015)]